MAITSTAAIKHSLRPHPKHHLNTGSKVVQPTIMSKGAAQLVNLPRPSRISRQLCRIPNTISVAITDISFTELGELAMRRVKRQGRAGG